MAELVRVKEKFQVTIPAQIRAVISIQTGDYLEVSAFQGGGVRQYRTPDAIHLAKAEEACAQLFVTGDRGIDILLPMHRYLLVETAAITNFARAQKFINEFKRLGCRFALYDFGNGMSSFAYLKHLPVYYLKIDGAFINDIVNGPIDRAMVEAINNVAHLMGMQTIAEFVENLDQLELLREIGVDYVQRYAISRPELIFIFADAPSGARHAQLMNA